MAEATEAIEGDLSVRVVQASDEHSPALAAYSYHVVRAKRAGRWSTILLPHDHNPNGIGRIEIDDSGDRHVFKADGTELPIAFAAHHDIPEPYARLRALALAGRKDVPPRARSTDPFGFTDATAGRQIAQRLRAHFGEPKPQQGREEFGPKGGAGAARVVFDPSIGAITESEARGSDGGVVFVKTTYDKLRPGVFFRSHMSVTMSRSALRQPIQLEIAMTNVRATEAQP